MHSIIKWVVNIIVYIPLSYVLAMFTPLTGLKPFYLAVIILTLIEGLGGFGSIPQYPKLISTYFKKRYIRRQINLRKRRV